MRINLGFGVVLAVASLTAAGTAYGQTGAAGTGGQGTPVGVGRTSTVSPSSLLTAPNNLEQQANEAAANNAINNGAVNNGAVNPGIPGQVAPPPIAGNAVTNPVNGQQVPGMVNRPGAMNAATLPAPGTPGSINNNTGIAAGTVNQGAGYPQNAANSSAGYPQAVNPGAGYSPANVYSSTPYNGSAYSSNYFVPGAQEGVTQSSQMTSATPGYTNRVMPGMAGYNSINPMATTMAPGYYYAGTAGMPYATGASTGYSNTYVAPNYYTPGYVAQPRRGLFGMRRRNRVVYTTSPYGTNYYGNTTYGYN
ncbi:MAG: hypothetical protein ACYC61_33045, partial [Isosphaeraceae bacterium]